MITVLYRLIVAGIALIAGVCMFTEKDVRTQATDALVLVTLVLRALMIK